MSDSKKTVPMESLIVDLSLASIMPSKTNPRKGANPESIKDLAASVAEKGVLVPIIVRPAGEKKYELVAGARRCAASTMAGKESIPAIIRELTDDEAMEVQIIENLQREGVDPIDEAQGFQLLIQKSKYTHEQVAEKIGKPVGYVRMSIKLLGLQKGVVDALKGGAITVTHARLIARLSPAYQIEALKRCTERYWSAGQHNVFMISAKDLQSWIRTHVMLEMKKAPFDVADAMLVPKAGPCSNCPKRTTKADGLFSDITGDDRCADPKCYEEKLEAHIAALKAEEMKKTGKQTLAVSTEYRSGSPGLTRDKYEPAKPKSCEHVERAIAADGENVGTFIYICRQKTCKKHHQSSSLGSTPDCKERLAQEKREREKLALKQKVNDAILMEILITPSLKLTDKLAREVMVPYIVDSLDHDTLRDICRVMQLEPLKKNDYKDYVGALQKYIAVLKDKEVAGFLLVLVAGSCVKVNQYRPDAVNNLLKLTAEEVGVNVRKIQSQVEAGVRAQKKAAKKKPKKAA